MSDTHSIGDEIPFRRDPNDRKTGSLVLDQHRDQSQPAAPEQSADEDMPKDDNPLKRGQVT